MFTQFPRKQALTQPLTPLLNHMDEKTKQQNVRNINLLSSETVRFIAFRWAVIMKHIQHCFALETPCKSRPSLCPLHMKKSTVWFGFLMRWQGVFKVWLYWLAVNGSLVPSCHGSKNADGGCKIQIGCEPNMRQGLERRERTKVGIKSRTTEGLKKRLNKQTKKKNKIKNAQHVCVNSPHKIMTTYIPLFSHVSLVCTFPGLTFLSFLAIWARARLGVWFSFW